MRDIDSGQALAIRRVHEKLMKRRNYSIKISNVLNTREISNSMDIGKYRLATDLFLVFLFASVKLYESVSPEYIRAIIVKLNPLFSGAGNNSLAITNYFDVPPPFVALKSTSLTQSHYLRLLLYPKNSIMR